MQNPPVESVLGNVCGNWAGGAGVKIAAPVLSVVGITFIFVTRGDVDSSSMPAGLMSNEERPNDPPEVVNELSMPWPK